jgi:DNA-binding MarR family transcriptional regulator
MVKAAYPSALVLITTVERQLSTALAADLLTEGVTVEQWRVIDALSTTEGRPMSEIGRAAGLPAPTLTKVVDRLVAANLVHRQHDPEDRRRVLVLLTRHGDELRHRLRKVALQHEDALRRSLGETGFEQLSALLVRLHES